MKNDECCYECAWLDHGCQGACPCHHEPEPVSRVVADIPYQHHFIPETTVETWTGERVTVTSVTDAEGNLLRCSYHVGGWVIL